MVLLSHFFRDDAGFIVSSELVLTGTIGALATVAGLAEISHNVNAEMKDVGSAVRSVDQSFYFEGAQGEHGGLAPTRFSDTAN